MDPLSDILSILRPRSYIAGGFDLAGDWSVQFEAHEGMKCWALTSGSACLLVEGQREPLRLAAGDCVLMPTGRRYRLANDLTSPSTPFAELCGVRWSGGVATLGGGGETMILGGHFVLQGAESQRFAADLPTIVHLTDEHDRASMRFALDRMRLELAQPRPGGVLIVEHLAHLMLVQAFRLYLESEVEPHTGWLAGLANPRIAAAMSAIHSDPGSRWTLRRLATAAGMSRTTFAQTFKGAVGEAPIEYLTRWRMMLAGSRLREEGMSVSAVASAIGYSSEAAFGNAFKRVMGCSPRTYVRRPRPMAVIKLWHDPR